VNAVAIPRPKWPAALTASHFSARTIEAWLELFDGFNSGWIDFEGREKITRGCISIEESVKTFPHRE
jgi:hypothetical protein